MQFVSHSFQPGVERPWAGDHLIEKLGWVEGVKEIFGWSDAVDNWHLCLKFSQNYANGIELETRLTTSEFESLMLLKNWWEVEDPNGHLLQWIFRPSGRSPTLEPRSYRCLLFRLWCWEFCTVDPATDDQERNPAEIRQRAASIAAAHRTALAAVTSLAQGQSDRNSTLRVRCTPRSACLEACPWLALRQRQAEHGKEYPHFLWDTLSRSTIELPAGDVDYLVISHTWGRWASKDEKGRKFYVEVPGVPWQVPRNTMFEVKDIPRLLSSIPFDTRYIWFDLVCIPQDGSDLMGNEIARQAAIFSSAKWATIWFHEIERWSGLESAVSWLGQEYLLRIGNPGLIGVSRDQITENQQRIDASSTSELARVATEDEINWETLCFNRTTESGQQHMIPDGWFTSLWTLQESCLRPDMFLCSKSWALFGASPDTATPLDHLVALVNATLSNIEESSTLPLSVHELLGVFMKTAMHKLLEMSPIDIINFGNQRYCQDENRAVAIMSALGTTDWYEPFRKLAAGSSSEQLVSSFVHRRYPVQFLNEAKDKFGAVFFSVIDLTRLEADFFKFRCWSKKISWTGLEATILPVTLDIRRQRYAPMSHVAIESYPAVNGWHINVDGSVLMPRIGVIVSYPGREANASGRNVTVQAIMPGGEYFRGDVELRSWLGSFRPNSQKYAVCLFKESGKTNSLHFGILLERVYNWKRKKTFFKFGVVFFTDSSMGESFHFVGERQVNIKVL